MNKIITIRPEEHKDYKSIISLILRSFQEGTDYSDGSDIIALVEEIRDSKYYIPELSFVAEWNDKLVGHFMFSNILGIQHLCNQWISIRGTTMHDVSGGI